MAENKHSVFYKIELSAIVTVIGIILLFSTAVIVTLIAPSYVDPTWMQPTSAYQVQMYEVSDPNFYISGGRAMLGRIEAVQHIKANYTLLAFKESETVRIVAPENLQKYITRSGEPILKLTSRLLMLREPKPSDNSFDGETIAKELRRELQQQWEDKHPNWREEGLAKPDYDILEMYAPDGSDAFANASGEGILENWVDENYKILDETPQQPYHQDPGVIYVVNPIEYRVLSFPEGDKVVWKYDPRGEPIESLQELTSEPLGFLSREHLIHEGEHIFAIEGCWYCHTDQTRTLVQDVVLNGSDSYPAPPSSPNEYIYQKITFPGTRRIGPDLSRVGIKRPGRDWHMSHFWSPKTESKGSIMPRFQHFFEFDPRGTRKTEIGVPNLQFEAIFQYLMTKGTRITSPNKAWWLGKDPVQTIDIIEGRKSAK